MTGEAVGAACGRPAQIQRTGGSASLLGVVKALVREYDRPAMRPARRWVVGVAAIATALIVVVLVASGGAGARPAGLSRRGPGPIAHVAFPSNGGSETAKDTIPAGGSGQIATDQLPSTVSQAELCAPDTCSWSCA